MTRLSISLALLAALTWNSALSAQKDEFKRLVMDLDSKDAAVRFAALVELEGHAREAVPLVPRLLDLLEDSDVGVRLGCTLLLGRMGKPALKPLLERLPRLAETSLPDALWTLQKMGPDAAPAVEVIAGYLKHRNETVRLHAVRALGATWKDTANLPRYMSQLEPLLDETPSELRLAAIDAYVALGEKGHPFLQKRILRSSHDLAAAMIEALKTRGLEAVPVLLAGSRSEDEIIRYRCVDALGHLRSSRPDILRAMCDALSSTMPTLRLMTVSWLRQMEDETRLTVPYLLEALFDEDASVRQHAEDHLRSLKIPLGRPLAVHLKGKDERLRVAVARLLLESDPKHEEALRVILAGLKAELPNLRVHAALALMKTGRADRIVIDSLLEAQTAMGGLFRYRCLQVLTLLAEKQDAAVPALVPFFADADTTIRRDALRFLGGVRPRHTLALKPLIALFDSSKDNDTRQLIVQALGTMGPEARPTLERAAKDASPQVREVAEGFLNSK